MGSQSVLHSVHTCVMAEKADDRVPEATNGKKTEPAAKGPEAPARRFYGLTTFHIDDHIKLATQILAFERSVDISRLHRILSRIAYFKERIPSRIIIEIDPLAPEGASEPDFKRGLFLAAKAETEAGRNAQIQLAKRPFASQKACRVDIRHEHLVLISDGDEQLQQMVGENYDMTQELYRLVEQLPTMQETVEKAMKKKERKEASAALKEARARAGELREKLNEGKESILTRAYGDQSNHTINMERHAFVDTESSQYTQWKEDILTQEHARPSTMLTFVVPFLSAMAERERIALIFLYYSDGVMKDMQNVDFQTFLERASTSRRATLAALAKEVPLARRQLAVIPFWIERRQLGRFIEAVEMLRASEEEVDAQEKAIASVESK